MSVIRFGYSWPGTRPRTRHWVSWGIEPFWLLTGAAVWFLFVWPFFLGPLWLAAQILLWTWSGAVWLWARAQVQSGVRYYSRWERLPGHLRVMRLRRVL